MRHPPRSVLLAVAGAVALVGTALVPVVSASGATAACTVEYSVTGQWDTGFQGAVTITNNPAALGSWSLGFDFANGQRVTRGWNAEWSQSGTTVTAANESWNGALGAGASVSAGFLAGWSGSNAVPTAFRLNGTTCNVDTEPSPTPTEPSPTPTEPPPGDGTVAGEIGENTCSHSFVDQVMKWFDDRNLSYLGWTWNTWDCSSGPSLITGYDGTPTAYGTGLRDHLRALHS